MLHIHAPVYAGKIAYGRRAHEKIQGARNEYRIVKQDEYETYEGQHEAIIDPEKWDVVHERRLETGKKREKTHSLDHVHVLSGIVRCPVCGAQMYGSVNRKKRKDGTYYPDQWYYVCKYRKTQRGKECSFRRQPQQKIVDREVIAVIADTLRNLNFAAIMQEVMNERTDEETLKARREALTKSREQYAAAKDTLVERLDTLDYTDPAYDMKYADMEKRLDGLYADIARVDEDISDVERSLADARSAQATIETAYEWLEFCAGNLDTLDDAAKREIVEGFIERVDIFPERQLDGRGGKSIDFGFPVALDGTEVTTGNKKLLGVDRDSAEGGFYTSDACTKCGVCEKLCKNGNIRLTEDGPVWGHDCQQCMACIMWCPNHAIRHPNVPENRRRYQNPNVTLKDMMQSEFHIEKKKRRRTGNGWELNDIPALSGKVIIVTGANSGRGNLRNVKRGLDSPLRNVSIR
ncbi:MAG: EFR1 family ferrodoxin [Clostridiales bacterium]|nr:EFR1 family ferrodoxin [Clostridiales bacterium]